MCRRVGANTSICPFLQRMRHVRTESRDGLRITRSAASSATSVSEVSYFNQRRKTRSTRICHGMCCSVPSMHAIHSEESAWHAPNTRMGMSRMCGDILDLVFGFLAPTELFRLSCSERRLRHMLDANSKVWSRIAQMRWPDGPYSGIHRLKHMHRLGTGGGERIAEKHDITAMTAIGDTVVMVQEHGIHMWNVSGTTYHLPCAYYSPAIGFEPHIAMLDEDTFAVSIGSAIEIGKPMGERTIMSVPCCSVICMANGPGESILVVTDFGTVWHVICKFPGTQRERTRTMRLFSPCVIGGTTTGPATCAAWHDSVYYYGTVVGLYMEGSSNAFPKCIMRGHITSVVANQSGVAVICDRRIVIIDTSGKTHWIKSWHAIPGQRIHLFKDLLMCGTCTVNMRTFNITQVDATEHVICDTGHASAKRNGTHAILIRS